MCPARARVRGRAQYVLCVRPPFATWRNPLKKSTLSSRSVHRAALAGRDPPFVAHRRQASTTFPSRASRQFIPERSTERQGPLNDKRTQLVPMCPVGTNAVAPISRSSVSRGAHMPRCAPHQPVLALPDCSTCSRVTLCEGPLPKSDVFTPVALIKRESGSAPAPRCSHTHLLSDTRVA